MKKLLLVVAFLMNGHLFADTIAETKFVVDLTNEHNTPVIVANVKFSSEGQLTVSATKYSSRFGFGQDPEDLGIVSKFLKNLSKRNLEQIIQQLSNAELKTEVMGTVCSIMPSVGMHRPFLVKRDYKYDTDTYEGELSVIDTNAGCWMASKTFPVHAHDQQNVDRATQLMTILGTDLLDSLLD